jgi:hypothetical protein
VLDIGGKLIDRLWPDPTQAAQAKLELLKMQQTGELARLTAETDIAKAQIGVNQDEAKSPSLFVSGWRPFVGWVCGLACAWNWLGLPLAAFACNLLGTRLAIAPADIGEMMPLLMGMLGLGGLRTVEKINGVDRK